MLAGGGGGGGAGSGFCHIESQSHDWLRGRRLFFGDDEFGNDEACQAMMNSLVCCVSRRTAFITYVTDFCSCMTLIVRNNLSF
jgi:hypothetical protein